MPRAGKDRDLKDQSEVLSDEQKGEHSRHRNTMEEVTEVKKRDRNIGRYGRSAVNRDMRGPWQGSGCRQQLCIAREGVDFHLSALECFRMG